MKNRLETRVGIFFVLAALAAVLMLEVSDNASFFRSTYVLYADFNNINELKPGDPVKLAGVEIGKVETIGFGQEAGKPVRATLRIDQQYQDRVKDDSIASIYFTGLMGQNFVAIQPGGGSTVAMEPDGILKTTEQASLNAIMTTLDNASQGLQKVTKSFEGVEFVDVVGPLRDFLQANGPRMDQIVQNMETISGELAAGNGTAGQLLRDEQLYATMKNTMANMEKITTLVADGGGTIGKLVSEDQLYTQLQGVAENFTTMSTDLKGVVDKVKNGEGTIGKLLNDNTLVASLQTTADDLGKMAADLKGVSAKVAKGEGTAGKLIHDDQLFAKLDAAADDIGQVAADLKGVTTKVANGEGTVGKLINDDAVYNSLQKSASALENTTGKAEKLIDNADAAVATAQSVLTKVDQGGGTLGKLVNEDALYAETSSAMRNLREIMEKINQGHGTAGLLVNDPSLFKNAKATLQKVDNATETMEDQGPISVIGVMFNGLF